MRTQAFAAVGLRRLHFGRASDFGREDTTAVDRSTICSLINTRTIVDYLYTLLHLLLRLDLFMVYAVNVGGSQNQRSATTTNIGCVSKST